MYAEQKIMILKKRVNRPIDIKKISGYNKK